MEVAVQNDQVTVEPEKIDTLHLLAIDIDPTVTEKYTQALRASGVAAHCHHLSSPEELQKLFTTERFEIVLLSSNSAISINTVFGTMQKHAPDASLVLYGDIPEDSSYDFIIRSIIHPDNVRRGPAILLREFHDVVTRRRVRELEEQLFHARAQCSSLMTSSQEAISYLHAGMHIRANESYRELFVIPEDEEVEAVTIMDLVAPDDRTELKRFLKLAERSPKPMLMDAECVTLYGDVFPATLEFSNVFIDNESCTQLIVRKKDESPLNELEAPDSFGGTETLMAATTEAISDLETAYSAIYIGITDFLDITDTSGILAAEAVLADMGQLLIAQIEGDGTLGRLGENGFVVIRQADAQQARKFADQLLEAADKHAFNADGAFVEPSVAVGIACTQESPATNAKEFIDHAYQAYLSTNQQHPVVVYEPHSEKGASISQIESVDKDDLVGQAITHNTAFPMWQGMISTKGAGKYISYHVTPILEDAEGNHLDSAETRKLLEQNERSNLFDHLLLKRVMEKLNPSDSHLHLRAFVELSPGSLNDAELASRLEQMLSANSNCVPKQLVCVFKATTLRTNFASANNVISELRERGIMSYMGDYCAEDDDRALLEKLPLEGVIWSDCAGNGTDKRKKKGAVTDPGIRSLQEAGYKSVLPDILSAESLARSWGMGADFMMGPFIHEPSSTPDFDFAQYQ